MPPNPRPRATLPAPLAAEVETLAAMERRSTSNMIAVLVAEAIDLRNGPAQMRIALCPGCCREVARCDEDRCCVECGAGLIVAADRQSADLLAAALGW